MTDCPDLPEVPSPNQPPGTPRRTPRLDLSTLNYVALDRMRSLRAHGPRVLSRIQRRLSERWPGTSAEPIRLSQLVFISNRLSQTSAYPAARTDLYVASRSFITHPVGRSWLLALPACPRRAASEATVPRRGPSVPRPIFQFYRSPREGRGSHPRCQR